MKRLKSLLSVALCLLLTLQLLPNLGAGAALAETAAAVPEANCQMGDFKYNPEWEGYEQWKPAVPDLTLYEVEADSDLLRAGNEAKGNRYIQICNSTFITLPINVRAGEIVLLDIACYEMINRTDRGCMFSVEQGGTLVLLSSEATHQLNPHGRLFSNIDNAIMAQIDGSFLMLGGYMHCETTGASFGYALKIGKTGLVHVNGGGFFSYDGGTYCSSSAFVSPESEGEMHLYNGYSGAKADRYATSKYLYLSENLKWHIPYIYKNGKKIDAADLAYDDFSGTSIFGERIINNFFTPTVTPAADNGDVVHALVGQEVTIDLRYQPKDKSIKPSSYHPLNFFLEKVGTKLKTSYRIVDPDGVCSTSTEDEFVEQDYTEPFTLKGTKTGKFFVFVAYQYGKNNSVTRTKRIAIEIKKPVVEQLKINVDLFSEYEKGPNIKARPAESQYALLLNAGEWTDADGNELTETPTRGVFYYKTLKIAANEGYRFGADETNITLLGHGKSLVKVLSYSVDELETTLTVTLRACATHLKCNPVYKSVDSDYHSKECSVCGKQFETAPHQLVQQGAVDSSGKATFTCVCGYSVTKEIDVDANKIIKSVKFLFDVPRQGQTVAEAYDRFSFGPETAVLTERLSLFFYQANDNPLNDLDTFEHGTDFKYKIQLLVKPGYTFASNLVVNCSSGIKKSLVIKVSEDGRTARIEQTVSGNKILIPAEVTVRFPNFKVGSSFADFHPTFSAPAGVLQNNTDYFAAISWVENGEQKSTVYAYENGALASQIGSNIPTYQKDTVYTYWCMPASNSGYSITYKTGSSGTALPSSITTNSGFALAEYFTAENSKITAADLALPTLTPGTKTESLKISVPLGAFFSVSSAVWQTPTGSTVTTLNAGNYNLVVTLQAKTGTTFSPACSFTLNGAEPKAVTGAGATQKTLTFSLTVKEPTGSVIGTVKSYGSGAEKVTVALYAKGSSTAAYTQSLTGNNTAFALKAVVAGAYTLKVSKNGHVAQSFSLTVGDEAELQNITLLLTGDANKDGAVNLKDVVAITRFVLNGSGEIDRAAASCYHKSAVVDLKDAQHLAQIIAKNG